MITVFEMIEKGWEYKVVGKDISIKKNYERERMHVCEWSSLDRHQWVSYWTVYGLEHNKIYKFHRLKDAKKFVDEKLHEEVEA